MSFPRYPKYKPSGVEWLGDVPEGWEVRPLKYNLRLLTEKTDRQERPVALENIEGWTGRFIPTETEFQGEGIAFDAGDILFGKLRPYLAKAYLAESPGEAVGDFHVLRPVEGINSRFAQYEILNREFISIVDGSTFGSKMPRASWEFVGGMKVTTPPLSEQTAIAAFLDQETAKIDRLVAEQRRLMELLKEKRQAVISHAVTGKDEVRRMKDENGRSYFLLQPSSLPKKPSGIEWLGDVPEHWEVFPMKRDLDFLTSGSRGWAENYSDEGELFIRITNLTRGSISLDLSDIQRVAVPDGAEGSRTKVKPGDVLFSITAYLGSVAVVPEDIESAYVSQHVALARLRQKRLTPRWVGFVALSLVGKTWFETQSYGGTKIQLSLDDVRDLPITAPPISEQHAITAFLDAELAKFDTLTAEAQRAIDLLQERRTALISAAVTGQIDVRAAL